MGFFRELFSRSPSIGDLRTKLKDVERQRRRAMLQLRRLTTRQADLIDQVKRNRKTGNNLEVDYLWEELRTLKAEMAMVRRDLRVRNLEGISLKRYVHGLSRLEEAGDKVTAKKLLERVKNSGLDAKLAVADLDDRAYLQELQETLDDVGIGGSALDEFDDDPEKTNFLRQIDEIVAAEEAGNYDIAVERESELKTRLSDSEKPTEQEE